MRIQWSSVALAVIATAACSGATAGAGGRGPLEVMTLEPPPGAAVDSATTIKATVRYRLPRRTDPTSFSILAQFATRPGATTGITGQDLRALEGEVDLEIPLLLILGNDEVARPLEMWIFMNRRSGAGQSTVIARQGPFRFDPKE